MSVFNSATETIKQGGTRRGANMAVLRVDHPDILKFIECKTDLTKLTNFNISVAVTDEFMRAARNQKPYDLINPRTKAIVGQLDAEEVFGKIVQAAWGSGEPGVIFIDRINAYNPTPEIGEIESTNPCGEQPLLPYESCNLGSINLSLMTSGEIMHAEMDWDRLGRTVRLAVHFLDNVIDMNHFPLPEIEDMTKANRKIGLGVMGFADMLIQMGIPYDSEQAVAMARQVMQFIRDEARAASRELAEVRGPFPNYEKSVFPKMNGGWKFRNATTTTIAPTGTISIISGASGGIEPLFAVAFSRHVMDNDELVEVNPLFEQVARDRGFYTPDLIKEVAAKGTLHEVPGIPSDVVHVFTVAHDVSPAWHTRIQAAFQEFTDNAVSKTVNFANTATVEDVASVYNLAYDLGCKGVTIYRDGSRDAQVLRTGKTEAAKQPEPVLAATVVPQPRPSVVSGTTRMMNTGCGKLYITVNYDESGPFEIFGNMGKAGGCAASQTEALARLASLAFRCGVDAEHVIKELRGISCHMPSWEQGGGKILSCADAFAKAIERTIHPEGKQLSINFNGKSFGHAGACPDCGGVLYHEEGCSKCHDCGYSQCD
jgi:ribonucleoside-diphosphate reductase alpha chain